MKSPQYQLIKNILLPSTGYDRLDYEEDVGKGYQCGIVHTRGGGMCTFVIPLKSVVHTGECTQCTQKRTWFICCACIENRLISSYASES